MGNMMHTIKAGLSLLTISIACTAVMSGCQVNPATGRMQLVIISPEATSQLGNEAKPQLIEEYGGEAPYPELRHYVERVGLDLAQHVESEFSDVDWTFTVLDSDVINAFALPGGHVFITHGLLARFDNEAQLAGVLGHEIGHVTGRHIDERISQMTVAQVGLGILGQLTESQIALIGVQLVVGGYQLSFGRDQESEADELGIRYMVEAGYDPQGMMQVLEVLRQASEDRASPPEFLSTHPHPETRIRTVTQLINTEYAHTQDNPQYQMHRDRFQQEATPYLQSARGSHPGALAIMALAQPCTCSTSQ